MRIYAEIFKIYAFFNKIYAYICKYIYLNLDICEYMRIYDIVHISAYIRIYPIFADICGYMKPCLYTKSLRIHVSIYILKRVYDIYLHISGIYLHISVYPTHISTYISKSKVNFCIYPHISAYIPYI